MSNTRVRRNTVYFISAQLLDRGCYAALLAALTYLFGVGRVTDVFFVAVGLPVMVVNITMDGCFVTVLRALSRTNDEKQRWAVIGQSLILFGAVYAAIALLIAAGASGLVALTAPGLTPESRTRAIELLRLAVTMIPAQGIGQVVSSILIHRGRVSTGVWRPGIVSMFSLCAAFVGVEVLGTGIEIFIGGMVVGVWAVNLAYLVALLVAGKGNRLDFRFQREIAAMFSSALVNSGNNIPTNIALLVERGVATLVGPGALSAITLARTCLNLVSGPAAAAANSTFVEALTFPVATNGRRVGMLYGPLFISAPILALLVVDGSSVIGFLFGHGHANAVNANLVAHILLILVASFPFQICSTGLLRMYQAANLDKWFLTILSIGMLMYVAAAIGLGQRWGITGLAGIHAILFDLTALMLAVVLVRHLGRDVIGLPWLRWGAAGCSSLAVLFVRSVLPPLPNHLTEVLLDGTLSLVAYALAGWAFNLPGVRMTVAQLFRWLASRVQARLAGGVD
jgi:peptidoglycan biosynthesis protein MviN/MurJ (putative lipid II flippase)